MYIGTKDQLIAEVFRQAGMDMAERLDHVDNLTEALDLLLHAGDGSDTPDGWPGPHSTRVSRRHSSHRRRAWRRWPGSFDEMQPTVGAIYLARGTDAAALAAMVATACESSARWPG